MIKAKRMHCKLSAAVLDRILITSRLGDLDACDLVIEAASESEETKRRIFQNLRAVVD